MRDPRRLFLINGLLRWACMRGGWIPLSVRLVVDLDFTALELMLMGTSIELAILLGEVPTGVVADVFSRKWSVVLGTLLLGVAQFSSGIIDTWGLFLVTQFVWGLGWSFISGAEYAWVTEEVGTAADVEPLVLRRARLQYVAIAVGILGFGGIGHFASLQLSIMVAGGLGIAYAFVLAVIMPENNFRRTTSHRLVAFRAMLREGAAHTWTTKGLRVLGIVLLFGGMAAETVDRLDVRRLEDLGMSSSTNPIVVFGGIMIAKATLSGLFLWRWEHRVAGTRVVRSFATLLALVGIGTFLLAHVSLLGVAVVVLVAQGSLLDLTNPLIATWTNALAPSATRATVHSFIGQMRALGEILGGVILGSVAAVFTLPTALTMAAVLFLLAATLTLRARDSW